MSAIRLCLRLLSNSWRFFLIWTAALNIASFLPTSNRKEAAEPSIDTPLLDWGLLAAAAGAPAAAASTARRLAG